MSTTILRDCSKNIPHFVADSSTSTGLKWASASATNGPAFAVYATTNQSFNVGSGTKVTWDSEEFDTAGNFASNRFTPTTAGYYQINASCTISQGTSNYVDVSVYKNGTIIFRAGHATLSSNVCFTGGQVVYFNGSSDYVEVYVYAQGTSPSALKTDKQAYFSGVWIRS